MRGEAREGRGRGRGEGAKDRSRVEQQDERMK